MLDTGITLSYLINIKLKVNKNIEYHVSFHILSRDDTPQRRIYKGNDKTVRKIRMDKLICNSSLCVRVDILIEAKQRILSIMSKGRQCN